MIAPGAHHVVAGGAGFVGINLCRALLAHGARVSIVDNLSRGQRAWVEALGPAVKLTVADLSQEPSARAAFAECQARQAIDEVWHLAANSDIAAGVADPSIDLRDTFLTTFHILSAVKDHAIPVLHFASTSAVYGEALQGKALSETDATTPISNYGAMKLASEAQIRASVESGLQKANIFRFPNVIGTPATHGVMFDFVHKLQSRPDILEVLGDGSQKKPYLHVDELIAAMLFIRANSTMRYDVFNIGPADDGVHVRDIAALVRDVVAPRASLQFGQGNRGWVGDVPQFSYCIDKLTALGWQPTLSSKAAVAKTIPMIVADLQVGCA